MSLFALVDCNNFYSNCERVFAPALRGRPVVVLSNNDGCIIALSQEAKALGLKVGLPFFQCRALCDRHAVRVFSSNYALYGDMSRRVMETLAQFSPQMEIYSIDESFLKLDGRQAAETARRIRRTVLQWTDLPVSVGLAATKTLAKLANHIAKVHFRASGVFDLSAHPRHDQVLDAVEVGDIWGIGPAYRRLLHAHGITTALQLARASDAWVRRHLTVVGLRLVWELRGVSCLPLDQAPAPKKAIARARAFGRPVTSLEELRQAVATYTASAAQNLRRQGSVAAYLQVHVETGRYKGPCYANAATTQLEVPTASTPRLIAQAHRCLAGIFRPGYRYRRAGVLLSGLCPQDSVQLNLFTDAPARRDRRLMETVDRINARRGRGTLRFAAEGLQQEWKMRQNRLSPRYTTRWDELPRVGR